MGKKPGHTYPVKSGNEDDIKKLMDDLRNNKDPEIRWKAAETIGYTIWSLNPSLYPEIIAIYNKEKNPGVRFQIVHALYYLDKKKLRPFIKLIKRVFEDEGEELSIRIIAASSHPHEERQ